MDNSLQPAHTHWYRHWFNTPYYHILYKQRDLEDAEFFMNNLLQFLHLPSASKVLDIACGRGRHSIYLNSKGLDVVGLDLSKQNISYAKQFENESLHFFEHDMRKLFYIHYFDLAVNLFTSFGYFDSDRDHILALKAFAKSLKNNGLLVLDYFNTLKIINQLKDYELKTIEGIDFHLTKSVKEGKIVKQIKVNDHGNSFEFEERVQAYTKSDFERLFALSGLEVLHTFGNYALDSWTEDANRLIFICKKRNS